MGCTERSEVQRQNVNFLIGPEPWLLFSLSRQREREQLPRFKANQVEFSNVAVRFAHRQPILPCASFIRRVDGVKAS